MAKQKIVMKVMMADSKKRSKALQTAVELSGVTSASIDGDKVVVVGDGIDSVTLTVALRKRMGHAELVSVAPADEKKESSEAKSTEWVWSYPYYAIPVVESYPSYDPYCAIM